MNALEKAAELHQECSSGVMTITHWLATKHSQETLYEATTDLFRLLDKNQESVLGDTIRDELDVFWYALNKAYRAKLETWLAANGDRS